MGLLIRKKPPKPGKKLRRKAYIQLIKKPPKLDEKSRRKTRGSINKKLPKFDKETRKKIDHFIAFAKGEKSSKPS